MGKRTLFGLLLLLSVTLTGCLKEDLNEGTIILMGSESEVVEIESIHELDILVSCLDSLGITLPRGNTPPNVQGEFLYPRAWLYSNRDTIPPVNDTLFFRFGGNPTFLLDSIVQIDSVSGVAVESVIVDTLLYYEQGQHNRILPFDYWEKIIPFDNITDTVCVMGHDNMFTIYCVQECKGVYMGQGVTFDAKRGVIITGKMNDKGITDAIVAYVYLDAFNSSDPSVLDLNGSIIGRINVFKVKNGCKVIRRSWYPNPFAK